MTDLQMVWGWQPSLYLFLGGMGAGAFVTAALLYFRNPERSRSVACASSWGAIVCLAVGLLCLLTELTNPLRGLMLWQSFSHFTSWMTIGAWLLVAAMAVFFLFALLSLGVMQTAAARKGAKAAALHAAILKLLAVAGTVVGLGVAAYTGVLLMTAPGVPLWNSALLPVLFAVSGLDTGVALVELIAVAKSGGNSLEGREMRFLEKLTVALVIAELAVLALFFGFLLGQGDGANVSAAAASQMLLGGVLAPAFWGLVVVAGLALPMTMALWALVAHRRANPNGFGRAEALESGGKLKDGQRRSGSFIAILGPIGALAGGCALRFLVVMAGIHGDPLADAMASLFQDAIARL